MAININNLNYLTIMRQSVGFQLTIEDAYEGVRWFRSLKIYVPPIRLNDHDIILSRPATDADKCMPVEYKKWYSRLFLSLVIKVEWHGRIAYKVE